MHSSRPWPRLVIALTSLFNDSDLLAWLSGLFRFDVLAHMVIVSVLAVLAYAWALRRRRFHPEKRYGNEAALFITVLLTASALWQMGVWLNNGCSGRKWSVFRATDTRYAAVWDDRLVIRLRKSNERIPPL